MGERGMSPSGISLNGVAKEYGEYLALDVPNLVFEAGVSYALIGPNGAGKSTLLRMLAGVLAPTRGTVNVPAGAELGYLPQRPYVFDTSVENNVLMALRSRVGSKDEARRLAHAALDVVGMADMAQAGGRELSGGEAQRVALARLLALPYDVLLLDEPTAPLDIEGTVALERALADYCAARPTTLIVCTHAPSQALRLAARTVMLYNGAVLENGPTEQVLNSPRTPQAERFLAYWRI